MHKIRIIAAIAAILVLLTGCANMQSPWPENRRQIVEVLNTQAAAWNRGDIDGFMQGYWNSPDLSFSAGGKTERGWQATYDRYRARYPTRAEMGTLAFSEVDARPVEKDAALVLGRWHLQRDSGPIGGNFTLLFQKIQGHWLIVHDHTSVSEPPK